MVLFLSKPTTDSGTLPRSGFESVDFYITGKCNRRCTYCFLPEEFLDSGVMMERGLFEAAVAWAVDQGAREVTLLGGEPSLHPEFVDFLAIVVRAGLASRVVTNGSRRIRRLLSTGEISSAMLDRVAVSLDTLDPTVQSELRGPHALEDALTTVDLLVDRQIPLDINVTATTTVLDHLSALLGYADEVGCRRVNVHWPSTMGLGVDLPPSEIPSRNRWLQAVEDVYRYEPKHSEMFVEIERGFLTGDAELSGCALLVPSNLQLWPDGRAILCGLGADRDDWPSIRFRNGGLEYSGRSGIELGLALAASGGCASCPAVAGVDRACIYDKVRSDQ